MRYFVGLIIVLALAIPLSADPMPTWTPEQQEVIEAQQACWDSWYLEGFDAWVETCRPVADLVWWTGGYTPWTLEDTLTSGTKWRADQENRYYNISPHAVQIFGDTAVIYYSAEGWDRQWGEELRFQQQRAEVFIRIDGRWCLAGGLVAEVE